MMTYNSVAEIFDSLEKTRNRLSERVSGLSREQENLRPAGGGWSVGEILEHLAMMEERLSKMLGILLMKTEAAALAGRGDSPGGDVAEQAGMTPFTLDEMVRRSAGEKYQAPEPFRPTGALPVSDLLERMSESRAALRLLQPRIEAADLSRALYPHPVFGPLNFYQWLAFIGLHEERHLRQIETLMASPEYERAQARG